MASRRIEDLHPYLATAYSKACTEFDKAYPSEAKPFITCTYRSKEEQDELYSHGRNGDKRPIITNAKGGQSLHNYLPSFAFDIAFISGKDGKVDWNEELFKKFADIFCRDQFLEWGGKWKTFKDTPHFGFANFKWRDANAGRQPGLPLATIETHLLGLVKNALIESIDVPGPRPRDGGSVPIPRPRPNPTPGPRPRK